MRSRLLALALVLAAPAPGRAGARAVVADTPAQPDAPAAGADAEARQAPVGRSPITVSADLGGGGAVGTGREFTPSGVFEAEVTASYLLGLGVSPELSLVLGLAPGTYVGLRPGLHVALPDMPFYVRAAIDLATPHDGLRARWLLLGGGAALRFTDALGGFAEVDTGLTLSTGFGVPFLLRAGAFVSF